MDDFDPLDAPLPRPASRVVARDLLATGHCSAACLLSWAPHGSGCACRCRGDYHGLLVDAEVGAEQAGDPDLVLCAACGLLQCEWELRRGRCFRCGLDPKRKPPRMGEEVGYRRGFQQGFVAAMELLGETPLARKIDRKIYDWRYNWRSIARCSEAVPASEMPNFAWEARRMRRRVAS